MNSKGDREHKESDKNMAKRLTTEEFIVRAREKHGERYDYSEAVYVGAHDKLIIICKDHGKFEQTPNHHLHRGHGCNICAGNVQLTTEEFIRRSREIFGDKFDYSKVNYINNHTFVIIRCIDCNIEFEQAPSNHLNGYGGCQSCKDKTLHDKFTKTTAQFINEAREIHGNKYDYSKVIYINSQEKVVIICDCGNEFNQSPGHHLQGHGCPNCAIQNITKTTDQFVNEARLIFGDRYDYSETIYVNSVTPVIIKCNEHNTKFKQRPDAHLNSHKGCEICEKNVRRKTTEQFIIESKEIHGDKYDYSEVNYVICNTLVTITCNNCKNKFEQTPTHHLAGHGCTPCSLEERTEYKYEFDQSFFKEENDSPESFYIAGFLAGDGNLSSGDGRYNIRLALQRPDKEILIKILAAMKSNHPIYETEVKDKKRDKIYLGYGFTISCKSMYYDLLRFGITPQKSLTYQIPDWIVHHKFASHFVRGLFDSDGSIHFRIYKRKDNSIRLDAGIDFCGTKQELKQIHNILYNYCNLDIDTNEKNIIQCDNIYHTKYSGNQQVHKILTYLYENAIILLDRKFKRFQKLKEQLLIPQHIGGENNYNAKFTIVVARQIRSIFDSLTTSKLNFIKEQAQKHQVSIGCMTNLVYRKTYKEEAE
jgi:hypothetical protein